jgi:hypothetical protein
MDEIKNDVLNAVESYLWRWCVHCPDADHFIADITGPEEWVCSRKLYPGDEKCLRRDRYEDIQALARQIVDMVECREVETVDQH